METEHAEFLADTRTSHIIIHRNWARTLVARPTRMTWAHPMWLWPGLHLSWALLRSRPRSSADWTPGRYSSPEHVCQTSPQTASHLALFQRNPASEESTMDGSNIEGGWLRALEIELFYSHYLCVGVQGEQLQPGFTPHPGLNIFGALMRTKSSAKSCGPSKSTPSCG